MNTRFGNGMDRLGVALGWIAGAFFLIDGLEEWHEEFYQIVLVIVGSVVIGYLVRLLMFLFLWVLEGFFP